MMINARSDGAKKDKIGGAGEAKKLQGKGGREWERKDGIVACLWGQILNYAEEEEDRGLKNHILLLSYWPGQYALSL